MSALLVDNSNEMKEGPLTSASSMIEDINMNTDSNVVMMTDIDLTNPEVRGIIGDTIYQSKEAVGQALTLIDNTKEVDFSNTLKNIIANTQQVLDKGIQYFECMEEEEEEDGEEIRNPVSNTDLVGSNRNISKRNTGGLTSMIKNLLIDIKEEVLGLDKDDYDELADALLMTSRLSLMMAQGTLTKIEKVILPGGIESPVEIEEATQEEIEAYQARKNGKPIPRSIKNVIPKHRLQQGRLLWYPLLPQATYIVTEGIPNFFYEKPIQTSLVGVMVLPFSGLIIFFTPGILLGDVVLQELYKQYGSQLEIIVADSSQFLKLGYISCKLTTKQSFRMVKKQLKKMKADPQEAIKSIGKNTLHVVTHPIETASRVVNFGKTVFNRFHTIYKFVQSTR